MWSTKQREPTQVCVSDENQPGMIGARVDSTYHSVYLASSVVAVNVGMYCFLSYTGIEIAVLEHWICITISAESKTASP